LVSIRPEFAELIFRGEKTVELRRVRPKQIRHGDWAIVYVSSPIKALVGIFQIDEIHEGHIEDLWGRLSDRVGVSKKVFEKYYSGKKMGVGIGVGCTEKLREPVTLPELRKRMDTFCPPQSFRYLTIEQLKMLKLTGLH